MSLPFAAARWADEPLRAQERLMSDLAINGPLGLRRFRLEKTCDESVGHEHNYDHVTLVHRGRLKVLYRYVKEGQEIVGETREYEAGEFFTVKASVRHTLKALEPDTEYFCIFSHRDLDGVVLQQYRGNDRAYE